MADPTLKVGELKNKRFYIHNKGRAKLLFIEEHTVPYSITSEESYTFLINNCLKLHTIWHCHAKKTGPEAGWLFENRISPSQWVLDRSDENTCFTRIYLYSSLPILYYRFPSTWTERPIYGCKNFNCRQKWVLNLVLVSNWNICQLNPKYHFGQ